MDYENLKIIKPIPFYNTKYGFEKVNPNSKLGKETSVSDLSLEDASENIELERRLEAAIMDTNNIDPHKLSRIILQFERRKIERIFESTRGSNE